MVTFHPRYLSLSPALLLRYWGYFLATRQVFEVNINWLQATQRALKLQLLLECWELITDRL